MFSPVSIPVFSHHISDPPGVYCPVNAHGVNCNGNEKILMECGYTVSILLQTCSEKAGVICNSKLLFCVLV